MTPPGIHLQYTQMACGTAHTLALTAAGEVYAWGSNHVHQLGLQDTKER